MTRLRQWTRFWHLAAAGLLLAAPAARAGDCHVTNVPPAEEIEILDPGRDPTGKPAIVVTDDGRGGKQVDIAPTVLVHRYYYSGDRSFQAQFLPGGPTTVVVHHPKTGEKCYVDVQMPPGAPRVTYGAHTIDYDFGTRGVTILFPPFCSPRVAYRNGTSVPQATVHAASAVIHAPEHVVHATGVPEHAARVCKGTKAAVANVAHCVWGVGKRVAAPVEAIVVRTPLAGIIPSDPAAPARWHRDEAVREAAHESESLQAEIETLR